MSGVVLLLVCSVLRSRLRIRVTGAWPILPSLVVIALVVAVTSSTASGSHTVITSGGEGWLPSPWNGVKVFLSSPRHSYSGTPGRECGWEENINGRHWNIYAGSVFTTSFGSFYDRSYYTIVSANARDDLYMDNVSFANNWGADVYIVTHTNASSGGCSGTASYLLVMSRSTVSQSNALRSQLLSSLAGGTPGGESSGTCDGLGECLSANAVNRAYVELFFHDNQSAVSWFQGTGSEGSGGVNESWRYGMAVDGLLGYPR